MSPRPPPSQTAAREPTRSELAASLPVGMLRATLRGAAVVVAGGAVLTAVAFLSLAGVVGALRADPSDIVRED